ncbi:hypothetical protein PMAYCL1PPCAC_09968, partial [Pristionchus mayeri]
RASMNKILLINEHLISFTSNRQMMRLRIRSAPEAVDFYRAMVYGSVAVESLELAQKRHDMRSRIRRRTKEIVTSPVANNDLKKGKGVIYEQNDAEIKSRHLRGLRVYDSISSQ